MSDSLEFRLLRYIVAVAETGNFTRAAERLFLAQPSLSKQIRDLEEEIKFPIFERSREGVKVTSAGEMIVAYARETLKARSELLDMARAVHFGEVPPLRLGFSSFVNDTLIHSFRETYCAMFPKCEVQLAGGETGAILSKINQRILDCAILPMPIDDDVFHVQQISESPFVVCMRSDDVLAHKASLDIHEIAPRITIFPDPELQRSSHARLAEKFEEVGIPLNLACSASSPTQMQWMVKAGYGLALIDQLSSVASGLSTRPIRGVDWCFDTAFVYHNRTDHIALPFIERSLSHSWRNMKRTKKPSMGVVHEQLRLLA